jgi:hypothetical protein
VGSSAPTYHPQQITPAAIASAFAPGSQHAPAAVAASVEPQHADARAAEVPVAAAGLPQQPPAAAGVDASAGSAVNPPTVAAAVGVVGVVISNSFDQDQNGREECPPAWR